MVPHLSECEAAILSMRTAFGTPDIILWTKPNALPGSLSLYITTFINQIHNEHHITTLLEVRLALIMYALLSDCRNNNLQCTVV